MLETNTMFVVDENGEEKEMEILFTFENEDKTRKYVVFVDPEGDEDNVFASAYDDNGNLIPVDTDEEWEMIEEVIGAFQADEEITD